MKQEQVDIFEKVHAQLEGLHSEISSLSKKSQNDALNKFKLKFVNQILVDANTILGTEYRPFPDFSTFSDEDLPTTSDVAMMLTQYLNCFETLKTNNIEYRGGKYYWLIDGRKSNVNTFSPRKTK
ncbi:hypothetical protein QEG73_03720 [Chitinophagaceae bacterium 26-R-25]|nr:hypothetical protein [Chitinophagaceae bacterium 26-R-25]